MTVLGFLLRGVRITVQWFANARILVGLVLVLGTAMPRVHGFALLGPYAQWMDKTNGYRLGWDVGGPVNIGEEYRWNVPIVTYAFDQSFIDYFGSNGVKAVEQAIQILNDLPPASGMVVSDYPTDTRGVNDSVRWDREHWRFDLKSAVLAFLIEQLGLAEPERSMFVLRQWDDSLLQDPYEIAWRDYAIPDLIVLRNFDPITLAPTKLINGIAYTGIVQAWGPLTPTPRRTSVTAYLMDPEMSYQTAIADWRAFYWPVDIEWSVPFIWRGGSYCSGLTGDDIGGLRYLLHPSNINLEILLPDVRGTGTNEEAYVGQALRPGINKLTFIRQEVDDAGVAVPFRYKFTDTYFTNGLQMHQELERVVTKPDFLFCVADMGNTNPLFTPFVRTGTENWWNSHVATGGDGLGPGIIRPPIKISFDKLGTLVMSDSRALEQNVFWGRYHWASFDGSTNTAFMYPPTNSPTLANVFPIHLSFLRQWERTPVIHLNLQAQVAYGASAAIQISSNLTDWVTLMTTTNQGGALTWSHWIFPGDRFFRVVPR
jgi:hypothetical protein